MSGDVVEADRIVIVDVQRDVVLVPDDRLVLETVRIDLVEVADAVLVVQTPGGVGPLGATGPPGVDGTDGIGGQTGPPGPQGAGTRLIEFTFASPSVVWTVVHNLDTYAIEVNAFGLDGVEEIEGEITFPDANTVVLTWYYPEAGLVRLLY